MNLKQRYWIFDFSYYYPSGGLDDVKYTFDLLSLAKIKMGMMRDSSNGKAYLWDSKENKKITIKDWSEELKK